jgi:hypothetical protein
MRPRSLPVLTDPDLQACLIQCPGCGTALLTIDKPCLRDPDDRELIDFLSLTQRCRDCDSSIFVRVQLVRPAHDPWTSVHVVEKKNAVVRGKSVEMHRGPNPWEVLAEIR